MIKKTVVALFAAALSCAFFLTASADAQIQEFRGPISIKGKAFVDSKGKRFMIRGVAVSISTDKSNANVYDPLTDENFDGGEDYQKKTGKFPKIIPTILPYLKTLGVNTIRVYVIDPTQSHDKAMKALKDAGIYVSLELGSPKFGESVNREDPDYSLSIYNRYTSVIKAMATYDNVLNFSVGNEVDFPGDIIGGFVAKYDQCRSSPNREDCIKFKNYEACKDGRDSKSCIAMADKAMEGDAGVLKALARDMKAYMANNNIRAIPVGIAMQDDPNPNPPSMTNTTQTVQYYACGDAKDRMDFVALNAYRYQNSPSYQPDPQSGDPIFKAYGAIFGQVVKDYNLKQFPIPFYFSETGGDGLPQAGKTRDWADISQYYDKSSAVANDFSGEVAYMLINWSNEKSGLYDALATMSPMKFGGADNLSRKFGAGRGVDVAIPANPPDTMACVTGGSFKPVMPSNPAAGNKIKVTVVNDFVDDKKTPLDIVVVQRSKLLKTIGKSSTMTVDLLSDQETLIQLPAPKWNVICSVLGKKLKDGDKIRSPQLEWVQRAPWTPCAVYR